MTEAHYLADAIERLIDAKLQALRDPEAHALNVENVPQAVAKAKAHLWSAIERALEDAARVR